MKLNSIHYPFICFCVFEFAVANQKPSLLYEFSPYHYFSSEIVKKKAVDSAETTPFMHSFFHYNNDLFDPINGYVADSESDDAHEVVGSTRQENYFCCFFTYIFENLKTCLDLIKMQDQQASGRPLKKVRFDLTPRVCEN
jgi:hypothetical protein